MYYQKNRYKDFRPVENSRFDSSAHRNGFLNFSSFRNWISVILLIFPSFVESWWIDKLWIFLLFSQACISSTWSTWMEISCSNSVAPVLTKGNWANLLESAFCLMDDSSCPILTIIDYKYSILTELSVVCFHSLSKDLLASSWLMMVKLYVFVRISLALVISKFQTLPLRFDLFLIFRSIVLCIFVDFIVEKRDLWA